MTPSVRQHSLALSFVGSLALAGCTPKSEAATDAGNGVTTATSSVVPATTSSAASVASATKETLAAKTIANLSVASRHPGYSEAWLVKKKLVLVKCGEALVLENGNVTNGKTIKNDAFGSQATQCVSQIRGVVGDALVVQNSKGQPGSLLDVATDKVTPVTDVDAASHASNNPFGSWVSDASGVHFVRGKKGDGQQDYVLGKDALYAGADQGILRAADLKTGELIWEHGIEGTLASDPVVWETTEEIIAVPIRPVSTKVGNSILLFHRGDDVVPLWTGTIHGKLKGDLSLMAPPIRAASSQAPIAKNGEYTLQVSTRGPVLVSATCAGAGCDIPSQLLDVSTAKPSYEVDLVIKTFEQGCK